MRSKAEAEAPCERLTRERDEAKAHARIAFVAGVAWWEYEKDQATLWPSDRRRAEEESERRYPGTGWPTHPHRVREAEARVERLREALRALVNKLEAVSQSRAYESVFSIARVHGVLYRGDTWAREMDAAKDALAEADK